MRNQEKYAPPLPKLGRNRNRRLRRRPPGGLAEKNSVNEEKIATAGRQKIKPARGGYRGHAAADSLRAAVDPSPAAAALRRHLASRQDERATATASRCLVRWVDCNGCHQQQPSAGEERRRRAFVDPSPFESTGDKVSSSLRSSSCFLSHPNHFVSTAFLPDSAHAREVFDAMWCAQQARGVCYLFVARLPLRLHRLRNPLFRAAKICSSRGLVAAALEVSKDGSSTVLAICFDVDSTVILDEGIDELADFCGAGKAAFFDEAISFPKLRSAGRSGHQGMLT
ncbi:hypothetical protein HU200_044109 [Digitaria exilis]|uniref:Uncharacterized protein n=1 Tax=Digitaria exilis TaxID=1010633 RepID=A0A835EFP6_9POAL|nr:hypothetical protein HU200_044109 [Digitaria exilis]